MEDREIQNGGSLTVRESQIAMFVNEGKVADVFGPGMLHADDRDAADPHLPAELGQALQEPVQERRLLLQHAPADRPALGHDASRSRSATRTSARCACAPSATTPTAIADPRLFYNEISGTRERYTAEELDGQLRGLMLQHISDAVGASGIAVPRPRRQPGRVRQGAAGSDRAGVRQARPEARDGDDAERLAARGAAEDPRPEDRHGHGRPTWASSCSTRPRSRSRRSPRAPAAGGGGIAGSAIGLGAGVALGQVLAQPARPGPARRGAGRAGRGRGRGAPRRRQGGGRDGARSRRSAS